MNKTNNQRGWSGLVRGQKRPSLNSPTKSSGKFSRNRPNNRTRYSGKTSGGKRNGGGNRGRGRGGSMNSFNPAQFINTNPVETTQEVYTPKNSFDTFGLTDKLARVIASINLTTPTPIQDQIIPEILKGRDVIGLAETGTGKTAAFLIPLIEKTLKEKKGKTLILAPTRELAIQIEEEFRKLSKGFGLFSVSCVGGMNIRPQIKALHRTNHFVIGTPGRILDLVKRKHLILATVSNIVLDEADRMLDMGFIGDMKTIMSEIPSTRQTLFFSATMNSETENIVHEFLNNPVRISVKKKDVTNSIEQGVVSFEEATKFETLTKLLANPEFKRVLIFGAMKHSVEKLSKQLSAQKMQAESIHGNKNHGQRQRALQKFKDGHAKILVATDVAARGIHVDNVSHVINYDLPASFEDYVHRIGRTGRASKKGKALTFVSARTLQKNR